MLRSVAVARIQRGLGFRTDLSDAIVEALQEAQRELEAGTTLPSFLISSDQTLSTTSGSHTIAKPTGFIRFVEYEGPYFVSTESGLRYLQIKPYDEAKRYYSEYDAGEPLALSIRSASFAVWPEPDAVYSIIASWYAGAALLTSDIENDWLEKYPDLLWSRAGMIVAGDLEHSTSFQKFQSTFELWNAKYLRDIAADEEQLIPRQMGVNN
jgi:hypothetical protein